jgi:tetratricopeptide (TPR) repeat protein
VHTVLASVPSLIRAFDASARPLLVVSTAYDDTLERAFAERGEPCDVVFPTDPRGGFAVLRPDGRIEDLDSRSSSGEPLLEERPALLMLCGSTRHGSRIVVTEDDFVDFLLSAHRPFPTEILARLGRSHLLFLGYGVRGWTSRAAVARPIGRNELNYRSYAVARTFDAVEARLWETRGVEVVEENLGVYVVELERHLRDAGASLSQQEPAAGPGNVASYRETAEGYSDRETAVAALLQLAELHHEREDYAAEIEVCNQALERLPDDPNALHQRAAAYWYAERYDDAIRDFTRVLELQPDSADAYSGRGQALAESGRFEEAIPDLDRAMKTGTKTVAAYARNGKGRALGGLGRFKESLKELDRSLSAEPGNAWAYFNRALTWERMGDTRRAAADFRRALEANDPPLNPGKRAAARARVEVR